MSRKINFQNPFNGRKWLNLLKPHHKHGITFKPNLRLDKHHLGFSFKSNKYGLRGGENIKSDTVICGTSYAMGLSVNNGENWYELSDEMLNSFNIGMPVSPQNHIALLDDFYIGNYKHLYYIYHPNTWYTAKQYVKSQQDKIDIFKSAKWETNYFKVLRLYIKWKTSNIKKYITKEELYYKHNLTKYYFTDGYAYINLENNIDFINQQIKSLNTLFNRFEKVTIIRVPVKEEIALRYIYSHELKKLSENYNNLWAYFKKNISSSHKTISLHNDFDLDDYLPQDTHWSKKGNETFNNILVSSTI